MIDYGAPGWLALGVVIIAMAAGAAAMARWRQQARSDFAGLQAQRWPAGNFWLRSILLLLGAALIVLAAARPQWGERRLVRERSGVDLVIALDISQSMTASDVQPSRLALAQSQLVELIERERGSRIGLVYFAGTAILRSPLSTDATALAQLVMRADKEGGLARAGSDLGAALQLAAATLEGSDSKGKAIVLVSDGEDHGGSYLQRLGELRDQGIIVYTAGVGTPQGSGLIDIDPRNGSLRPKLDAQGRAVVTRLEEGPLQAIALQGGGRYLRLSDADRLGSLAGDLSQLDQTPIGADTETLPVERFQIFVALALIVLALAWLVPSRFSLPPLRHALATRSHGAIAVLVVALLAGACSGGDSIQSRNAAANRLYDSEDYEGALTAYQELLRHRPDLSELSINAGNALNRLEKYERAVDETQRALPPVDPAIGAVAYYDLGNHFLALQQFRAAYDSYKQSLLLNPSDRDAKHNLELSLALLQASLLQPGQPQPDQQTPSGQEPGESQPGEQQPGQPQPGSGSPAPQATPGPSVAEVQRDLQQALRGLDQNLTYEEALRILDLLRQQQQRQLPGSSGPTAGQDY